MVEGVKSRKVLITGMGGELGSLIASRFEQVDWVGDIRGFDMDPPRRRLRHASFTRIMPGDIDQMSQFIVDFQPQVIVHVGVWEPHARLATDHARIATGNVARAVFDTAHQLDSLESVVLRSGIEVYGAASHSPHIATEENDVAPTTVYGKICADLEARANALHSARGVNTCTLRLAPVVGPHVPSPLGRVLRMPAVPFHGLGNPAFCVVEDTDAADAFVSAGTRQAHGVVNICANGAISVLRATLIGRRVPVPTIGPAWWTARAMSGVAGAPIPDHVSEVLHRGRLAASNEAAHLLRFAPRHTTTEVIERLYEWPSIEHVPAKKQVA